MVATMAIEGGNAPYSLNFVHRGDWAVGGAFLSVPIVGARLLAIRSRHLTGWLMMASGVALSLGMLCHAFAVRLLVVQGRDSAPGWTADWFATWLQVPGLGLLAFVCATWPEGRYRTRWARWLSPVAAGALAIATLLQALAPDHLDGVQPRFAPANPLGVPALRPFADPVTVGIAKGLIVFAAVTILSAVAHALWRLHRNRRKLAGATAAVLLVPCSVLLLTRVVGDAAAAGVAVAIMSVGLAVFVVATGVARAERSERARALLVAEREDERQRLRRDLHDGLGPTLAALRLELDDVAEPGRTERARSLLDDALGEVRRISRDLRPAALDELGLVGALRNQAVELTSAGGPRIEVEAPEGLPPLGAAVEVALLRIGAEAMTNCVRHAHAGRCQLVLEVDADVRLTVTDDGVGPQGWREGVGLVSMRARAEELGGRFEVWPGDESGTRVVAILPPRGGVL
jgi:signal transduction histidine kinase